MYNKPCAIMVYLHFILNSNKISIVVLYGVGLLDTKLKKVNNDIFRHLLGEKLECIPQKFDALTPSKKTSRISLGDWFLPFRRHSEIKIFFHSQIK